MVGKYLKIPDYYDVVELLENRFLFHDKDNNFIIKDKTNLLKILIPYLNGKYTIIEISKKTGTSIEKIERVIALLKPNGLINILNKNSKELTKEEDLFFSRYNLDNSQIIQKLGESEIVVITMASFGSCLVDELSKFQFKKLSIINLEPSSNSVKTNIKNKIEDSLFKNSNLIIFCSDGKNVKEHHEFNKLFMKLNKSWLSARYYGDIGEIGPLVIPHKTACFNCCDCRLKSDADYLQDYLQIEDYFKNHKEKRGSLPIFTEIFAKYILIEIIKFLTNYTAPITINKILAIDFKNSNNTFYPILKVPNCPICKIEL